MRYVFISFVALGFLLHAAKGTCSEDFQMEDFSITMLPVGAASGDWTSCCDLTGDCTQNEWCIGTTYTCICTIKTEECADNITNYLQGQVENIHNAVFLGASEGWSWKLPFLTAPQMASGWKVHEWGKREPEMGNDFYPVNNYTATYTMTEQPLTAGSQFKMEVQLSASVQALPSFILLSLFLLTGLSNIY